VKDYKGAADSYKAFLALDHSDPVTHFRLGVAYLQEMPPSSTDGFWELSRSIGLKGPGEAQVRTYLRNQLLHYQQPSCDKLADEEMNQMITLATERRSSGFDDPQRRRVAKAREDVNNSYQRKREGEHVRTCG
jgi:hypothetical protein